MRFAGTAVAHRHEQRSQGAIGTGSFRQRGVPTHYDPTLTRVQRNSARSGALESAVITGLHNDAFSSIRNLAMTEPKKRRPVFFNLAKIQIPVGALTSI